MSRRWHRSLIPATQEAEAEGSWNGGQLGCCGNSLQRRVDPSLRSTGKSKYHSNPSLLWGTDEFNGLTHRSRGILTEVAGVAGEEAATILKSPSARMVRMTASFSKDGEDDSFGTAALVETQLPLAFHSLLTLPKGHKQSGQNYTQLSGKRRRKCLRTSRGPDTSSLSPCMNEYPQSLEPISSILD